MKQDFTTGRGCSSNYYYHCLMINGEIKHRPAGYSIDLMEEDPQVKIWWKIGQCNKSDAYKMIIRAYVEGANRLDLFGLANAWQLDDEACKILIQKDGLIHKKEDGIWVVSPAQINSVSCGKAATLLEAACIFYDNAVHA